MEELTDKIERFLTDQLSDEERNAFNLEMEKDAELRKEVELQKKIGALLEANARIELEEKVRAINQSKNSSNWIKPLLQVAAAIVVLLIPTYFYMSSQFSDANLYAEYASPHPDRITNMGEAEDQRLSEAMELYNQAAYKESAILFSELRTQGLRDENVLLYEAVSLMNSDQADKAITLMRAQLALSPKNQTAFEWQLILAYLANDEGEKALPLVADFLKHNKGYQQENASQLLSDLESIWR